MRIIFAGTPEFAAKHLAALLDAKHDVVAVYTQPDRPAGRGKKLTPSPVKQLALEHDLPVYQPKSLRNAEAQAELAAVNADLMIVVAYGLLLPQEVLDAPRLGCINVHASILPRWRGAAPIQRAIEAGDRETGVTIQQMDIGLDTGDMLVKSVCEISDTETGQSLHDKLIEIGCPALLESISQLANGTAKPEKQDDSLTNYAHKLNKAESLVDWQHGALEIQRRLRAFTPWPGCQFEAGGHNLKLLEASVSETQSTQAPGTVVTLTKQQLEIATGDGVLRIEQVQLPGKKPMSVRDLLNARGEWFTLGQPL